MVARRSSAPPYGGLRWLENLRHTYGDSGNSTIPVRVLGGSLGPYAGWKKQSGGLMVRLRGDSESKDLVFLNTFGTKLIIHYAVEVDGGTCDVNNPGDSTIDLRITAIDR
jgi:hypothetical protein